MHDSYPTSHKHEKERQSPDLEFIQGMLFNTSCLPQFQVQVDEEGQIRLDEDGKETPLGDEERFRLLSDLGKNAPLEVLEDTFDQAGYGREDDDFDDDGIQLARIGLMVPNYIMSQAKLDQCSREYDQCKREYQQKENDEAKKAEMEAKKADLVAVIRELVDFNAMLKETICAYPNLSAKKFANFLQGDGMAIDLPEEYRNQSEIQISRAINGARGEEIFKQTLNAPAMQAARIFHRPTDAQTDVWGIDCVADVTLGRGNEQIVVYVPIDVKSTFKQVVVARKSRQSQSVQSPAYAMKDNAIIMCCGFDLNYLDKLLPDDEKIEENARQMVPVLRDAAHDYEEAARDGRVVRYQPPMAA